MRIRTVLSFVAGAAAGFGAAYLGDPDHGSERRRDAGKWAVKQAAEQASRQASKGAASAASWWASARSGWDESRN